MPTSEEKRRSAIRAARIGAMVLVVSLAVLLTPLLIPMGQSAKYPIAIALIGALGGLGIMLNGAIDWWRGR
jgi:hypothetical protein